MIWLKATIFFLGFTVKCEKRYFFPWLLTHVPSRPQMSDRKCGIFYAKEFKMSELTQTYYYTDASIFPSLRMPSKALIWQRLSCQLVKHDFSEWEEHSTFTDQELVIVEETHRTLASEAANHVYTDPIFTHSRNLSAFINICKNKAFFNTFIEHFMESSATEYVPMHSPFRRIIKSIMQASECSQLSSEQVIPNCGNVGISCFLRFWLFPVLKAYPATEECTGYHTSFLICSTHSPDEPHHLSMRHSGVVGKSQTERQWNCLWFNTGEQDWMQTLIRISFVLFYPN